MIEILTKPEMPKVLEGKLQIGNGEQIEVLKIYEDELAEYEEQQKQLEAGEIDCYRIKARFRGKGYVDIWAKSHDDAMFEVIEDKYGLLDIEIDTVNWDWS